MEIYIWVQAGDIRYLCSPCRVFWKLTRYRIMQWKMLSGLEHEVRTQLHNTQHKHDILLNVWMAPDSLTGIFSKSYRVFYWWHFHIYTHEVNDLGSIGFIVSPVKEELFTTHLWQIWLVSARGDHNVPSHAWKSLRWTPEKTQLAFLFPEVFFWAGVQKCSKSRVCRTQVVLPALSPRALLGIPCTK